MNLKLYNTKKDLKLNSLLKKKQYVLTYTKFFIRYKFNNFFALDNNYNILLFNDSGIKKGSSIVLDNFFFKSQYNKNFKFLLTVNKQIKNHFLLDLSQTLGNINNIILLGIKLGGYIGYTKGIIGFISSTELRHFIKKIYNEENKSFLIKALFTMPDFKYFLLKVPVHLYEGLFYPIGIKNKFSKQIKDKNSNCITEFQFFFKKKKIIYDNEKRKKKNRGNYSRKKN